MAAGDTVIGRRIQPVERDGKPRLPDGWHELELGCYIGPIVGYTGDNPAVHYRLPNGEIGHVCSPPHTFTEEEDGSLTISPSILATPEMHGFTWHGYLERGVWREV